VISVKGLRFGYPGSPELFTDLDLVLPPGAMTALTGLSGTGKSTLLYILGLLLRPADGRVSLGPTMTENLRDDQRSWLRAHRIGFVFQDAALDPTRTVLDNVTETALYTGLPRRVAEQRALQLLHQFGVDLRWDHKPGQVSGGQAQRVALCRALLHSPPFVLADEPTGNLDRSSADVVLTALSASAADGATVVIATHDPVVVQRCDNRVDL
jgi:ABC-type lipoprotein export system ATPase subunit